MRARPLGALLVAAGIALTACGSGGSSADSSPPSSAPSTTAANDGGTNSGSSFGDNVVVKSGTSNLGPLLVGPDGKSLYAFTNDTNATSTCFGTCATAWPPLIVPEDWQPGPGLDSAVFSSIIRTDGQRQLVAGKYPLYQFSGDAAPGDVNGQGSAGVWFAVAPSAALLQGGAASGSASGSGSGGANAAPAATVGQTTLGQALVDDKGHTLYGLTKDSAGTSTCVDACATAWPPVIVQSASLPSGLDANVFSVISRADGSHQLKAGKWPLYRFSGDAAQGDVNGQGSGGVWFVVAPNGSLNKG